jgi:hypothetical protein
MDTLAQNINMGCSANFGGVGLRFPNTWGYHERPSRKRQRAMVPMVIC